MAFFGVGTRSSPIALVDSEDEVYYELYKDSNHSSSSSLSVNVEKPALPPPKWTESHQPQPSQWDRKRKRTHSFTNYDAPMIGPSVPQRGYPTLENRLSQPESKKARKRRRKAERQALEDARLQNINWLNGPSPFASGVPILPLRSWSSDVQMYGGYPPPQSTDRASRMSGLTTGFTPPFTVLSESDDFTLYDNREPHSATPPPPPSQWVSSMAKAASDPIDSTPEAHELSKWSPLSTQIPLPPLPSSLPAPLPAHPTNTSNNISRNLSALPKPAEHHALPPKPPPPQTIQTTIGMKPDQEPNSKHGIFQLASATKEAGTDLKKKGPLYMPNPARTLVMEQLPKSHRHPDFINNWGKSACGALPVHIFIDGPGGKALIEFATAELARKAWASPKLGSTHVPQVKGKPREDLIKVWWYRVAGVGAGSGVGEIEEGEIEGDAIEREADQPFRKETKKEKKARLAKEREEKRVKRELELRLIKERNASLKVELPTSSTTSSAAPEISYQRSGTPILPLSLPRLVPPPRTPSPGLFSSWSSNPPQAVAPQLSVTSDSGNLGFPGWRTPSPSHSNWNAFCALSTWTLAGQADDLDDYDNMEIDEPPLLYPPARPAVQTLPLHSSLPPRPVSTIVAPHPRAAVQRAIPSPPAPPPAPPSPTKVLPTSRSVYEAPRPPVAPPLPPLLTRSSSSSSTPSPTSTPSEPRAMKNAPTEPSFTKRALIARQKELEEKIAKSKLELAETRAAAAGSTAKAATPPSSVQTDNPIPVKPSMDLGEKQAMEDRLRKLVLKSRERGRAAAGNNNGDSTASVATTPAPSDVPSMSPSISTSSSSSSTSPSSVSSPIVLSNQLTTVSLSAHDFSLEDLAVSFITQTIETIKSKPALTPTTQPPSAVSTPTAANKPVPSATQSNNNNTKLELAAKQKRLEQHITESKKLMTQLAQARSKEEKDAILKTMREMTRSFEEGSQSQTTTATTTMKMKPSVSESPPTPQGPLVRIWPGSHEDAGVLILSDSDDGSESDEE